MREAIINMDTSLMMKQLFLALPNKNIDTRIIGELAGKLRSRALY
jgi:hypothetical protein